MKKIIFFIILSEVLLSLSIERNKNSIIPYFLRLGSNETLITLTSSYDTLDHKAKFSGRLHIYIKLFSKEIEKSLKKTNKNSSTNTSLFKYKYKSNLGLKIRNKKPSLDLKNSFLLKYKNLTFYEEITPSIPFFYTENTTLEYSYKNQTYFLNKSFTYKSKGMDYSIGVHFSYNFYKYIKTITFSMNGNTSKNPLIYSYIISTSFRHTILNKRYFYFDLNPYILISKNYDFKIKPAFKISINYDF